MRILLISLSYFLGLSAGSALAQSAPRTTTASPSVISLAAPLEIETGMTSESLTNGYAPWSSAHVGLSHKFGERRTLYGSVTQTERFSLQDEQVTAGLYSPLGRKAVFLVEAELSPTHRVAATDTVMGEVDYPLEHGWVLDCSLRHSDYAQAHADLETLTAERYFGPYHAAWTVYAAGLPGRGISLSQRAQIGWYYTEHSSISLAGSLGSDLETLGPGRVGAVAVTEYDLSGHHWLTPGWGISYALGFEHEGNRYSKRELTFGLSAHL